MNFNTGYSPYTSYVDSGYYAEQIQRYIDTFGIDRVKIIFLDDLKADPKGEMARVFKFIGVEQHVSIDYTVRNEANSVLGKKILRILKYIPGRKLVSKNLKAVVYNRISCFFRAPNKKNSSLFPIYNKLINIYEPHICRLEQMTGRNLSDWRHRRDF